MAIKIAGKQVQPGDLLYHMTFKTWGHVKKYDRSGSAVVVISDEHAGSRTLLVREGGYVNGKRVFYWHKPIEVDLPIDITEQLQAVVDANIEAISIILEGCKNDE